ncbi:MAG: FtsX-like permease family protein [Bacteroidia bacterium]
MPLFIAKRYLFSPKSNNAINVITLISMLGIMVGTAATILVLSVFNGFTGFIDSLFSAMDADLRIEAAEGKSFVDSEELTKKIKANTAVFALSKTIEDKAILNYLDRQAGAVIKGVDTVFRLINPIDSIEYVYNGKYDFRPIHGISQGVLGTQVAANLNLNANLYDEDNPIKVFVKTGGAIKMGNPMLSFKNEQMYASGIFTVQKEYDDKYVLVDINFARDLFDYKDKITAYELALKNPNQVEKVKRELQAVLGKELRVLTLQDKHTTLYKVMRNEKWVSYLILTLLLTIVSVNIIGSLSMIVIEKTKDIAVMKAIGATDELIRRVFLTEGLLVGGIGGISGLLIGGILALLQIQFGFVKLNGGESFRVDAFPVQLQTFDFVVVFLTVLFLSVVASLYPSMRAAQITVNEGIKQ